MTHATLMSFGKFVLRKSIRRSRIFDLWRGERRQGTTTFPCLVRRLLPPYSMAEETVAAFRARVQSVSEAQIPHAMRILEQGVAEDIPFAAMSDVSGWSLQTLLDHHGASGTPMPLEVATHLLLHVLEALSAAHGGASPMVHGALRPSSLWLSPEGVVAVGDFEIGRLAEMELTSLEGQEERAWRFIAPEREEDWAAPDPSVDIYSCGALLLECLVQGRLSAIEKRLDPPAQISLLEGADIAPDLLAMIGRALGDVPAERPSVSTFQAALRAVAANSDVVSALEDYLARDVPPVEILDPLEKPPLDDEETLVRRIVRKKAEEARESGQEVSPNPVALQTGKPPSRRARNRVLLLAAGALLLAAVAGYVFREPLRRWIEGPNADLTLLIVETVPEGATVTLPNGRELGKTPLHRPLPVSPDGKIGIIVHKDDWKTVGPVYKPAEPNAEVLFRIVLKPLEHGPATARITTVPPGARIRVDGTYRGLSPIEVPDLHSAKEHVVVATLKGYLKATETFRVEPERPNELRLVLTRASSAGGTASKSVATGGSVGDPASSAARSPKDATSKGPHGYLVVDAIPWAHVSVDGKPRGRTDPRRKIKVSVGRHVLTLTRGDLDQAVTREVTIQEGSVKHLVYDFVNRGWRLPNYQPFE